VFLPPGVHHLQAWNEAVCAGRWGGRLAALGEKLRRAVDLEHWAAFNRSFERLCDWLRSVAAGIPGTEPPATIVVLGGDVHHAYPAGLDLRPSHAARVYQLVCPPFRNPLSPKERLAVRATSSPIAARIFAGLARLAGVPAPSVDWHIVRGQTFDNSLG